MPFNPISAVLDIGGSLIKHFFPDAKDQDAARLKLLELQQSGALAELAASTDLAKAQDAINQVEAGSSSLFIAGWRPAIGWICGLAFLWSFVLEPICAFLATLYGWQGTLPRLNTSEIMPVLLGMLGLGAYRSYDKTKGAAMGHG